jgi:hypothetical protein
MNGNLEQRGVLQGRRAAFETKKAKVLVGIAVSVLSVGAVTALRTGHSNSSPEPVAKAPPPVDGRSVWQGLGEKAFREAPLGVARERQRHAFQLLRGRSERMPDSIHDQIARSIGAQPGEFQLEFTHRIPGSQGLWVVGGDNLTCIAYNGGRQTACDTAVRAASHGLALGIANVRRPGGRPEGYVVTGLAPDWVRRVRVKVGATKRRVPVENNTYVIRAKQRILLERLEPSS